MSIALDDPEVIRVVSAFYTAQHEGDWIILTYTPERDRIIHLASGPGGVDAFGSGLAQVGEDVGFGCLQEGGRVLFLTFLGEGVGGVKRARAMVHGRLIGTQLLHPHDATWTINDVIELGLGPSTVRQHLGLEPGAEIWSSPGTGFATCNDNISPAGSKRTPSPDHRRTGAPIPAPPPPPHPESSEHQPTRPPMPTLRTLGPPYPISNSSRPTSPPSASGSHFTSSPLHESTQSASPVSRNSPDLILSSESSGQATEHALFQEDSPLPASSSQFSQPTSPTAADDHVSRFASSFGSKSKPNPPSSASRAPGIPLFSAFSVLSRKGKKRATMADALVADISNDGAPPPVPPKDRVVSAPVSAATSTRLQISFPLGNRTPSPSPHRGNGLSYAPRTEDDAHSSRSYGEDENDDLVARTGPGFRSAHPSNAAGGSSGFFHRRHFSGGSAKGGHSARRASLSSVISGGGGSGGYHRRGPSEISHSDAYDAYDTLYGAVAPALTPSTARMGSLDLSLPPRLPSALQQLNSPGGTRSVSTPVHAAYSTGRSVFAGGTIDPSSSLSSASALSPTSATSPSSAPPPSALSPTTSSPSAFSTISRLRAGSDSDCLSPASTWLSQQTNLRRESDREALRERLERDGPERRRLKEEEKLRLEKEHEERVSERLERARERTARLMEEERIRREEEKRRTEKERLERSEEEEKEMIRIRAELGRAREEGGRLADGWLTVQAPGSVLFRRRYFHISPLKLELFKNAEDTAEPLMTIHLPSSGGKLAITDAYEEIQVLHSFRMGAKDGQGWLFYLDSESDKAIVVEALKVAASV